MSNEQSHLNAVGSARPLRVAYLIDPAECPSALLDTVFAEAYARWGGRRTLIVPANRDGVDPRYSEWLRYYDADVIYSFLEVTDSAVAHIHERYGPAHLVRHQVFRGKKNEPGYYRIELPLRGLSSLSVVSAFLGRRWDSWERVRSVRILDKYFDQSGSQFLQENFGFLSENFGSGLISRQSPDLFTALVLISQKALDDPHMGKDPTSQYKVDEIKILEVLGQRGPLMTLAQLSDFFTPHLDTGDDRYADGLSLVAGDSVDDRLLFWNGHHHHREVSFSEITGLRIPKARLTDIDFLMLVKGILQQRGKLDYQGQNNRIMLRSCSIGRSQLEECAEILRKHGSWLAVQVARHDSHAACVPEFRSSDCVWRNFSSFRRHTGSLETTEFSGDRVSVPAATPWHLREALPPAELRGGSWMVDLTIDRSAQDCSYSIARDRWVLPRRLRLERAFTLEQPAAEPWDSMPQRMRVNRDGAIALPHNLSQKAGVIGVPNDLDAFARGLCNPVEWAPFDRRRKDALQGLPRYRYAEPSDKGRYLLAVLGRFDRLLDGFSVFMNAYWRDELHRLGAVPAEKNLALRDELIQTLRKRLRSPKGDLVFRGADHQQLLAREAIRFGRKVQREARYVSYEDLKRRWGEKHPKDSNDDWDDQTEVLDQWIQHLCQHEILFQGREWLCRTCFNRNWITIDRMGKRLTCEVCGRDEPSPVSGDWHFRANAFLVEAFREHGVEAVIWTLWQLSGRARRSFYFAPSMRVWDDYPETKDAKSAEIDALVIVDGKLYLCEVKSSAGLREDQVNRLIDVANKVRPDTLLIACMDETTRGLKRTAEVFRRQLDKDIGVELLGVEQARELPLSWP